MPPKRNEEIKAQTIPCFCSIIIITGSSFLLFFFKYKLIHKYKQNLHNNEQSIIQNINVADENLSFEERYYNEIEMVTSVMAANRVFYCKNWIFTTQDFKFRVDEWLALPLSI